MQQTKDGCSSNGEESPDTTGQEAWLKDQVPQGKPAGRKVPQKTYHPFGGQGEKVGQEPTVPR